MIYIGVNRLCITYKVHVAVVHRRIEHHLARVEHRHRAGIRWIIRRGTNRGLAVPVAKVVAERGGELCGVVFSVEVQWCAGAVLR